MNSYIKTFLLSDTEQFQNDIRLTLRVFFFYSDKRSFPSFLFNAVPWRHVCNISDYYSTSSL